MITQQQVKYDYIGEGEKENKTSKKIKKILIPNQRIFNGFIFIVIIVLIIAATKFPLSAFLSGDMGAMIDIGIPLVFLEFKLSGAGSSFLTKNFIIDLLIYSILAYIINIILNFLTGISLFKKKEEIEEEPTVFKDQKITTAEKLAEKVSAEI